MGRIILIALLISVLPVLGLADQTKVQVQREKATVVAVQNPTPPSVQQYEEVVGDILKFQFQKGQTDVQRQATVWLSVRTKLEDPIADLQPGDFSIVEIVNGVRRNVPKAAVRLERRPLAACLLRDVSGSMFGRGSSEAQRSIGRYIDQMRPGDLAELVFFGSECLVVKSFTDNKLLLKGALHLPVMQGGTAILDAVAFGLNELQRVGNHYLKTLVVVTDGGENASAQTLESVAAIASSAGIPVFAVGVGEEVDAAVLQRLARASKGKYFSADVATLTSMYDRISRVLRASCVLSYPTSAESGDTVGVEVTIIGRENQKKVGKFFGQQVAP